MEITFFTSSLPKLAHARHILARSGMKVHGFREKTYYANYQEPRIYDRDELLKESYENAVKQAERAGILTPSRFFFLEDTSVEINCLSDDGREVPGLEVKYWMRENIFETVDALLKSNGNDRRATVRSHIVLHIPDQFRQSPQHNREFVVFSGEQRGHIVDCEQNITTNLMYPWLDNRTFNKWFVPTGSHLPISKMKISEADKFDFRRPAFEKMAEFISKGAPPHQPATRLSIPFKNSGNLLICGYPCAGKTTAGQQLAREHGYLHIEASDFMYLAFHQRHGFNNEFSISDFTQQALLEQPEVAAAAIVEYLREEHPIRPWVITGFRAMPEIEWLQSCLKGGGQTFETIFIDADIETRFKRMTSRNRSGDTNDRTVFEQRDEQQKSMGLANIRSTYPDACVPNINTLDEFKATVSKFALDAGCKAQSSHENSNGLTMPQLDDVALQDAILISLLSRWSETENRDYFTTTEISHLTGKVFPAANKKQKDNISRHFNQSFYPYYETKVETGRTPNRYRLSNTGYSEAINRFRELNEEH